MLPFLAKKNQSSIAGTIIKQRTPDAVPSEDAPEDSPTDIESCVSDLITAVHSRDTQGAVAALKAAFKALEAAPHEEGPHTNDYEAQNIKAAKKDY